MPRNYISPHIATDSSERVTNSLRFGMFLPDFEGYTEETAKYYLGEYPVWHRFIQVINLTEPRKSGIQASAWGEPAALFDAWMSPHYRKTGDVDGLECFGAQNGPNPDFELCKGKWANGELLVMRAFRFPDGVHLKSYCEVRYFSAEEDLYIEYRYALANIVAWREIDEAIWKKVRAWRVPAAIGSR